MNQVISKYILMLVLFSTSQTSLASPETHSKIKQGDAHSVNESQIFVSNEQREFWSLTETEWQRYQQVKPIAKLIGQTEATPVEVLGIFAQTDLDRERYAKIFVQKQDAYVANLLQFQRTVSRLQGEFYKNIPILDPERIADLRGDPIRSSDRIQFFSRLNCVSCDLTLLKLIRQVNKYNVKLDVFFENATASEIQQYAQDKIPPNLVDSGQITINVDNGYVAKYKIQTPAPFISQAGGALKHHDPDL